MRNELLPEQITLNDDDTVTIDIPGSVRRGIKLYHRYTIFQKFVNDECQNKAKIIHEKDDHLVTNYEVTGFLYNHQGESYTIPVPGMIR